ncbi:MAG: hypothetical protein ACREH8_11135, partial [Opitutaceae bacterium]
IWTRRRPAAQSGAMQEFVFTTGPETAGPQGNFSGHVFNVNGNNFTTDNRRVWLPFTTRARGLANIGFRSAAIRRRASSPSPGVRSPARGFRASAAGTCSFEF